MRNYKTALKAGLASYLASSLVIVVLLLPYLSNLPGFGHFHKPDTAKHIHSLAFFIQTDLASKSFLLAANFEFICFLVITYLAYVLAAKNNHKKSRAPPEYSLFS
ncbi:MAG TPA: hypothetical protein ENK21_05005 [Trueperaceae bacterium]|nr:hypothetical protein [Trueperaceae bacterium]